MLNWFKSSDKLKTKRDRKIREKRNIDEDTYYLSGTVGIVIVEDTGFAIKILWKSQFIPYTSIASIEHSLWTTTIAVKDEDDIKLAMSSKTFNEFKQRYTTKIS